MSDIFRCTYFFMFLKDLMEVRQDLYHDIESIELAFNSKSWYSGTIEPNNFNENVLSKVEIDNIKALKLLEGIPELPPADRAKEYLYYMTVYYWGNCL